MTSLNTSIPQAVPGLAQIANLGLCDIALERALSRTASLPGLVCFYGPSGYGKSCSAAWVAAARRAYYVQARSVWSKKHTLKAILAEMGIRAAGTIAEMADQVAEELAASGRPLIIDEMDHLVDRGAVELVRDIYEASQAAILLIGEEMLPTKLKKFERFHGRVLSWVPAQPVTLPDAKQLVPVYSPQVEIAEDLLSHVVTMAHGSVRRVAVNLELLAESALTHGHPKLSLADLKRLGIELYTGEAPKRRVA